MLPVLWILYLTLRAVIPRQWLCCVSHPEAQVQFAHPDRYQFAHRHSVDVVGRRGGVLGDMVRATSNCVCLVTEIVEIRDAVHISSKPAAFEDFDCRKSNKREANG